MKNYIIIIFLLFVTRLLSQPTCGIMSDTTNSYANINFEDRRDYCILLDKGQILRMPIVFHIVSTDPELITDEIIFEQLDILNKAFRRNNKTSDNVPLEFAHLRADTGIEFCFTTQTPSGETKISITRTKVSKPYFDWQSDALSEQNALFNAAPLWPTNNFINIYISYFESVPRSSEFVSVGFAYPDVVFPISDRAFVAIDIRTLPKLPRSLNSEKSFFGKEPGDVLIHEIGHYLRLPHTFGNRDFSCDDDDGISDTPRHKGPSNSEDCPSHPHPYGCDSLNKNIMFMNYMDYSPCRNIFTKDQATKMRCEILSDNRLTSVANYSNSMCISLRNFNSCGSYLFGDINTQPVEYEIPTPLQKQKIKVTWGGLIAYLPNSTPANIDGSNLYIRYKKFKSSNWKEKQLPPGKNEVILEKLDANSIYDYYLVKKCGGYKSTKSIKKSFKTYGIIGERRN